MITHTKKILFILATIFILCGASVSAKVGDIRGEIYSTDILTQVDGLDIKSYAIDGRTLIALEDLEDYGFTVYYNDNIRTVFITKTGTADVGFKPQFPRGKVGQRSGYYYETDIRAFVNGTEISAYAINGKMVAEVEELGDANLHIGRHKYHMQYTYNDNERLLSLYTSLSAYGAGADDYITGTQQVVLNEKLWGPTEARVIRSGDKVSAFKLFGGVMHGGYAISNHTNLDNGLIINPYQIARLYSIYMSDAVFSLDGERLIFKNNDENGNFRDYKQMELNSMHVYPATEAGYLEASETFKVSDYVLDLTVSTDNVIEYPLYLIGSEDYISFPDLVKMGYTGSPERVKLIDGVEYVPISEIGIYNDDSDERYFMFYSYDTFQKRVHATIKKVTQTS